MQGRDSPSMQGGDSPSMQGGDAAEALPFTIPFLIALLLSAVLMSAVLMRQALENLCRNQDDASGLCRQEACQVRGRSLSTMDRCQALDDANQALHIPRFWCGVVWCGVM